MFRPLIPALLATLLVPTSALACGGFFCDAIVDPVVQTAERVLFRVNDDDTVTTVVEVQFEGEPTQFGWVLPLSETIEADAVETAPAGLFDELEALSAPVFVQMSGAAGDAAGYSSISAGCGNPFFFGSDGGEFVPPDTSGVEVVGSAVVGPYAVEIITAESADNLVNWLQLNGYQVPSTAMEPIAHYVTAGMSFLGLKLNPDVPAGPIDALSFTTPGSSPMLPLVLTSVAATEDMEITAYVLAPERYAPLGYVDLPFDWDAVGWTDDGTNYEALLPVAADQAGGRAFVTELAQPTEYLLPSAGEAAAELLGSGAYLTRFRTFISADEMTLDPSWGPAPELGDVSNVHMINDGAVTVAAAGSLLLFPLFVMVTRRRP